MKRRNEYAILSLLFLGSIVGACKPKEGIPLLPELEKAQAVMYEYPDSALHILQDIRRTKLSDEFQKAAWCLLLTQAKDKNYIKHTSDSLINVACKYFENQDDLHWKALAYNYKGVVNQQLGNVEEAVQDYLKSANEVEKTKDYQLAYLIYSNLGMAYTYRSLTTYAMESLQKAYEYANLSGNKVYICAALSYIARVYSVKQDWEKALEYYKEAEKMAVASGDLHEIGCTKGEISMIYAAKKEYDLAMKCAREALNIAKKEGINVEQMMLNIADIYRFQGINDSAYYYCKKVLVSDNVYTLRSTYFLLYILSKKQKKYEDAIKYSDQMWNYTDSIHSLDRNRAIIEIQEKYNQQKLLNEKNQLQIEKERTLRMGLTMLIFLLIGIILVIYKLFRKQKQLQESKEQISEYQQKINSNEILINTNRNHIEELLQQIEISRNVKEQVDEEYQTLLIRLQYQNEKLHNENNELQTKISHYSASLQDKLKSQDILNKLSKDYLRLRERESFLCAELIKHTKILSDLKASPKYLDVVLWNKVCGLVNELYDNFEKRLHQQFSTLTEGDIQLCCLIKLRFSISEIAIMRGVSPTSISQQKTRLKKRLAQELGSNYDDSQPLDLWLWDY